MEAGLAVAGALVAQAVMLTAGAARALRAVYVGPARIADAHEAALLCVATRVWGGERRVWCAWAGRVG